MKYQQTNFKKKIFFCLILLFLGLMSASITYAEPAYLNSSSGITVLETGDGQFDSPHGIAVDSLGSIYVADSNNSFIEKFENNGYFMGWLPYDAVYNQSHSPYGIAIDSSNLYVADTGTNCIKKFNPILDNFSSGLFFGSYGTGDGQFDSPHGIAVDSLGSIYVADSNNSRIEKFTNNGDFIAKWGTYGTGNGQFHSPDGIAVDSSGNVYVADTDNHRIEKFTNNGDFIAKWGTYGTGNGQFDSPHGIAVDSSGNVYVADSNNNRIEIFTSNGDFLTKWGSWGTGDGQFDYPCGVDVDSSGNVYVADTNNARVQKFALVANFSSNVSSGYSPLCVQFTDQSVNEALTSTVRWKWDFGDGNISNDQNPMHTYYAIGNYNVTLTVSNAIGLATKSATINVNKLTPTVTWSNPADINDTTPLSSTQLNAIASVPGNFSYNPKAGTVLSRGTYLLNAVFTPTDTANYSYASVNVTINVTFSSSKILKTYAYIPNELDGTISVIDTATDTVIKTIPCVPPLFNPFGVAVTPDGSKVIITDYDNSYGVLDTANETLVYADALEFAVGHFPNKYHPWGVVISPDGTNAYISNYQDFYHHCCLKVDLTNLMWSSISNSVIGTGIAVSTDGTKVYVANGNIVYEFDVNTGFVISTIPLNGGAFGLAMSPDGKKLYAAGSNVVQIIDTSTDSVISTVDVGSGPFAAVVVSPNGSKVYVTNSGSNTVSVIDTFTRTVTDTVPVGNFPQGISITPDGGKAYVANSGSDTVSVIDTSTNIVINTIPVGSHPVAYGQFIGLVPISIFPIANFSSNITSGNAPLSVQFNDSSLNATLWNWDFGDGQTSTDQSPSHTYNSSGTYTVSLNVSNLDGYNVSTELITVSKSTPAITWANPSDITYGTALSSAQLNAEANLAGTFVYTPEEGTVLPVGTQPLHVEFTPTDAANYSNASADVTINVTKAPKVTPEITWANSSDITYGTALSGTQLNAEAKDTSGDSIPGTYVYTPAEGAVLGAGTQSLHVEFTPTDAEKYNSTSADVSINVIRATPVISWNNPDDITVGIALSGAQLNATCSVPGTFVYTPEAGTKLPEGTHILHVDFAPTDAANYTTASKNVSINVGYPPLPEITWNNPTDITYGTALNSTQLNAVVSDPITGVTVSGQLVYIPGEGTVLGAGTHTLNVNFTPADMTKYNNATANVTININKAIPAITWNKPADINDTTPLSNIQLNAVASVNGTYNYTPAAGTILIAGIHTLHVDFTPKDTANYTNATANVTINVIRHLVPPVANFSYIQNPGTLLVRFNDTSTGTPTSWNWDFGDRTNNLTQNPVHTYSTAETYTVNLTVSNADGTTYKTAQVNVLPLQQTNGLIVYYDGKLSGNSVLDLSGNNNNGIARSLTQQADPVTGANYLNLKGSDGKYIDILRNAQTNVSSPMSIEFKGSVNTITKYGAIVSKYKDSTTGWYLACSGASPYNKVRFGVNLMDGRETSFDSSTGLVAGKVFDIVVTYDNNVSHIYVNGYDNGSKAWNSPIKGGAENITFAYGNSVNLLNSGNCSLYTFRLYNRALSSAEVLQIYNSDQRPGLTPTITWNNPANITYPAPLNSTQLNAVASVPGTYVYTPANGTVLNAGNNQNLQVVFTPDDTVNYNAASKTVQINVSRATPTITWSNPADITYGTALSGTQLNAVVTDPITGASVPGTPVYTPPLGTVLLADNNQSLQVVFTPTDIVNYNKASKNVSINVTGKPQAFPVANFTSNVTSGTVPFAVQFTDSSQNATGWNWDFDNNGVIDSSVKNPIYTYITPGIYPVTLNVSNAAGYNILTKPNYINVTSGQVTNGPAVYYNGTLSGNSVLDFSGNNNTGYATRATQRTNQSTGTKYILLNGSSSKIDVTNNPQTNISSPMSIEFIGSINAFSKYGALVSKYNNGVLGWYLSCSATSPYNKIRFGAGLKSGSLKAYESNISLVAGQVYDIAATYDNNVSHIYINGVDSGTATWNSPIAGITNNITIGYGTGLAYCNCSMYSFRLYNRALSPTEVLQNYNNNRLR